MDFDVLNDTIIPTPGSTLTISGGLLVTTGIQESSTNSITAAGTTQGTATALTTDYNVVTTTASGTGVVLPAGTAGRCISVVNRGANTLNIYPAVGGQIDALGTNIATTLVTNATLVLQSISATQWYIVSNSGSSGGVTTFSAGTTGFTPNSATSGAVTLAGTLNAANGGTGNATYAIGDLLQASATTTLLRLPAVATGNALISGGVTTQSTWGKIGLTTHISGTLAPGNGGTGATAVPTNGQLLIGNGTNFAVATLGSGTGISTTPGAGTLTINNTGVTSNVATANQTTVSGATGAVTVGLSSTLIAPGSLQVTTSTQTSATNTISAAGTTQGTGTVLTTDYNVVTTTAAGTGVVLPAGLAGRSVKVVNRGANALLVYPATGAQIDALGANVAISVIVNGTLEVSAISATQWYVVTNSVAGGGGAVSSVTGTANQITASPTTGAVVLTLPSTVIAPGTVQATGSFIAGTATASVTSTTGTAMEIIPGVAATSTSAGNHLTISAGPGGSTSGAGGNTNIYGGSVTDGQAGSANLFGANAAGTGFSGGVAMVGGVGGSNSAGGSATVLGGQGGPGSQLGGGAYISGGNGGGTSGAGGEVSITGGTSNSIAAPGAVNIKGGGAWLLGSRGGDVNIEGTPAAGAGNDPGGSVTITAGDNTGSGAAGAVSIKAGNLTSAGTPGAVTITGGNGTGSTSGGIVTVIGGTGGQTGVGATAFVTGGPGGSTSGNGGLAQFTGGTPTNGVGGAAQFQGGNGVGTNRAGGQCLILGGTGTGTAAGGLASVQAGPTGTGTGGVAFLTGGAGGTTGTGGDVSITAGAGGSTSGAAGRVFIQAGTPVSGAGGNVTIAASAGVGTNQSGGNLLINAGASTGTGSPGIVTAGSTVSALVLPTGTTAQRPGSANQQIILPGMIRLNTTESVIEEAITWPANATKTWAGLQASLLYTKRRWWQDDFMTQGNTTAATSALKSIGELSWNYTASTSVAIAARASETDHPGIIQLATSATNNSTARIHMATTATGSVIMANQVEYFAALVRVPTITTGAWKVGIGQDISDGAAGTYGTNGVWFEFAPAASSNWRFYTRSASTSASPSLTLAVVANTWYLLEAVYDGTAWNPRINGANYVSISTNVPTTAVNVGFTIQTNTTASRTMDIDYFAMISRELGNRY
jgi:hypothetical protein